MARREDDHALAHDAAAVVAWIATTRPFQVAQLRGRRCLYCRLSAAKPDREPTQHGEGCLWRRARELRPSASRAEQEAIARDFVRSGPWEHGGKDGLRHCLLCESLSPMHKPSCLYWRMRIRLSAEP